MRRLSDFVCRRVDGGCRFDSEIVMSLVILTDDEILALSLKHIPPYESTDEQVICFARAILDAHATITADLLEVLEVIAADSRWTSGEPLLMQVRAVIAKATGEKQ
jgi:hypothetical protein